MKTRNTIVSICLLFSFSFATITHANPHRCPSLKGIKDAIQNKNSLSVENYMDGNYSRLGYFSPFDTNETWYFYYMSDITAKNANNAWNKFQSLLDTTPNPPIYAKDNFYNWDCVYIYKELQIYMLARLMSP